MLERNDKSFYSRKETFADPNSQVEIESAVKVGVRIAFDLLNGQIILTETAFASADAFTGGAVAIPQSDKIHVISGDQFDQFIKDHSDVVAVFKTLFQNGDAEMKRLERIAAEMAEKERAERFETLKKEIEAAGGKVVLPE